MLGMCTEFILGSEGVGPKVQSLGKYQGEQSTQEV